MTFPPVQLICVDMVVDGGLEYVFSGSCCGILFEVKFHDSEVLILYHVNEIHIDIVIRHAHTRSTSIVFSFV